MTTPPKKYQVFREPKNLDEFEQMLRLRFEVFSEKGEMVLSNSTNEALGFDLNAYDICSIHFGLFECDDAGDEQLIGTVRFIDAVAQPKSEAWVREILLKYEDLSWDVLKVPSEPLLQVLTRDTALGKSTEELFKKYRSNGSPFFEVSRLALKKEARELHNGQKAIESAWTFVFKKESNALFGPDRDHKPMYQPYFVYPLMLSGNFEFGLTTKSLVFGNRDCLHPSKRPRIEKMAAALRDTGQIVFLDDLPDFRLPEG